MAQLKCDLHGTRTFGPNSHVYPALVDELTSQRATVRLCSAHTQVIMDLAEPWLTAVDNELVEEPRGLGQCMGCGRPVDNRETRFFMTLYPKGEKRLDYFGYKHIACRAPEWLEGLFGSVGQDRI